MNLVELGRFVRQYWKMVALVSAICMLAGGLTSSLLPTKYEAIASITVSDPSNNVSAANMLAVVNDFVQDGIAAHTASDSRIEASATVGNGGSSQTLFLTVKSQDSEECVRLANSIVDEAAAESKAIFAELQEESEAGLADLAALNTADEVASVLSGTLIQESLGTSRMFEFCTFLVSNAVAANGSKLGVAASSTISLIAGFMLAILILIIINALKRPINDREELEGLVALPVLYEGSCSDIGDRLWANTRLSAKEQVSSICLVPLGDLCLAECAESLAHAIEKSGQSANVIGVGCDDHPSMVMKDGVCVYDCAPLKAGVEAIYCANEASATVICAYMWRDSIGDLERAVRELALIDACIVGVALLYQ